MLLLEFTDENANKLEESLKYFVETNTKLTDWYLHSQDDFIIYVLKALDAFYHDDFSDWSLNFNTGTIDLKKKISNTPDLQLSIINDKRGLALYYSKTETIILYALNNQFLIPDVIGENLYKSDLIKNTLIHELTHYYDDMMLKGKGHLLKTKKKALIDNAAYFNQWAEMNAYTKQLITALEKPILHSATIVLSNSDKSLAENFTKILNLALNDVLKKDKVLNKFINNLTEQNRKKVYKEVGLYYKDYFTKNYGMLNYFSNSYDDGIDYNKYLKNKKY